MSTAEARAAEATLSPHAQTRPGWLERQLRGATTLFVLHLFVAFNLLPIMSWMTLLYFIFPPFLAMQAWAMTQRAPLFATIVLGVCCVMLAPSLEAVRGRLARIGRRGRLLIWTAIAIWLPIFGGEAVRASMMHTHIAVAAPECHATRSLLTSLRIRATFDVYRGPKPHAWMVRDGIAWLWSYRTLRFEPAPNWSRAPVRDGHCAPDLFPD